MTELLTSAQMRAVEQAAIASGAVTGLALMERAGRGVVEAIFAQWPELAAFPGALPRTPGYLRTDEGAAGGLRRAVVLCGPGNNGGDGFVVARLLKELGWGVAVTLCGDPERMPPDARVTLERWLAMGAEVAVDSPQAEVMGATAEDRVDLVIDALFGTGLSRDLPVVVQDLGADLTNWMHRHRVTVPVVAVDMPSGLCADSGRNRGGALRADLTVTFHAMKLGHVLEAGPELCGKVRVVDIGLPQRNPLHAVPVDVVQEATAARGLLGKYEGHKYRHGHALVLSGPPGHGGAARLAARGALRIGAGVVTIGCLPDAIPEHAARLDAVMLRAVADGVALEGVLEDRRISALCLGPGMGTGAREAGLVAAALGWRGGPRPLVLDADALTLIAREAGLFSALHKECVLTPHGGEFARLFPDIAAKLAAPAGKGVAYSKVDAAREAAARAGCVVLIKGPDTVIAGPDGRCAVHAAAYDRATPWLATAGSGDVLAGFITGLLARGFDPSDAACTAAWLHVECALSFGPGLIAEDLPEQLPKVFRALGL